MPLLMCPNCNSSMQAVNRGGVELDMCPTCRGVWLDRGELEKLVAEAREQQHDDTRSREKFDREVQDFHRDPEAWRKAHPYDERQQRHSYDDDDDHYRHHQKKKRGFELFDFFD